MDLSGLEWVLEQICAETCWALPAHVNRKKDEKWKITLDLFACETAQSLLEIAFLLRNDLRPELLCRIWKESSRRVLQPFLIQENGAFWWETSKSNWNAVCCGSVGAAACYASELFPVLFPNSKRFLYQFQHYPQQPLMLLAVFLSPPETLESESDLFSTQKLA